MQIPRGLSDLLAKDQRLLGAVQKTLGDFEPWIADNKTVFFPGFTDHGTQHLQAVVNGAESLIEDDAWGLLGPRDAACLVLAVLLHDCAMHLSKDGLIYLLESGAVWKPRGLFAEKARDRSWRDLWDEFAREASRWDDARRAAIFGRPADVRIPKLSAESAWDEDQFLLAGEFVRRNHARLAHEIAICGVPGVSRDRLRFSELPEEWMADLCGFIARSHNMSLRQAVDRLERQGRKAWRGVHVPYLMAVLRVADYLELDAPRAPRQILKIRSLRSPISRLEWRKHHAVHDIRPHEGDPQALFVDAEPKDVEAFISLRRLFADLQREIDDCWNVIGEVYGSDAELRRLGVTIRRIYSSLDDVDALAERVDFVPVDAQFRTSGGELLKLLVGPLYGDNPSFGARELMQNAVDACRELNDWRAQHPGVPVELVEQRADVVVLVEEREDGSATFTIQDRGIGMTAEVITDYFLTAGASFRSSDAWRERHVALQGGSRVARSGRFGVGAVAAFLIGPEIEVETRFVDSPVGFRFTCRLDSPHIELKKHECPVGTRIRIEIPDVRERGEIFFATLTMSLPTRVGNAWDWYAAASPSLARGVKPVLVGLHQREQLLIGQVSWLEPSREVPSPGADLGEWVELEHADYAAVHWSARQSPGLWCNGFEIRAAIPGLVRGPVDPTLPPVALSVWDHDGRLPLSLRRDRLTTETDFGRLLARPVCRDFLAYLLMRLGRDASSFLEQLDSGARVEGSPLDHSALEWFAEEFPLGWPCLWRDSVILCDAVVFARAKIEDIKLYYNTNEVSNEDAVFVPRGGEYRATVILKNGGIDLVDVDTQTGNAKIRITGAHEPNTLAEEWLAVIGPRGIPLDPTRRRLELHHAYEELAVEIARWERITAREAQAKSP